MGSEKKQEREGAELRPRKGQREEGERSRRPGSGLERRVSEAKPPLCSYLLTLQALYQPPYSA